MKIKICCCVDEDENEDDVSSSFLLSLLSKVVTVVSTEQFENASFVFSPPSLAITITPVIFCNITPADMSYLTFHSACFWQYSFAFEFRYLQKGMRMFKARKDEKTPQYWTNIQCLPGCYVCMSKLELKLDNKQVRFRLSLSNTHCVICIELAELIYLNSLNSRLIDVTRDNVFDAE